MLNKDDLGKMGKLEKAIERVLKDKRWVFRKKLWSITMINEKNKDNLVINDAKQQIINAFPASKTTP